MKMEYRSFLVSEHEPVLATRDAVSIFVLPYRTIKQTQPGAMFLCCEALRSVPLSVLVSLVPSTPRVPKIPIFLQCRHLRQQHFLFIIFSIFFVHHLSSVISQLFLLCSLPYCHHHRLDHQPCFSVTIIDHHLCSLSLLLLSPSPSVSSS